MAVPLESADRDGRLSRYSFIGTDYLAAAEFEADGVFDRVRAFVDEHRIEGSDEAGAALVALRVHMHNLRKKIEEDPDNPRYLVTVPAQGLSVRPLTLAVERGE